MNIVSLQPSCLQGTVQLPPSKSAAHRAMICSFLAGGGTVSPMTDSKDMRATQGVIQSLKQGESILNCLESGSTLRFMIPVAAALGREVTFAGEGSLLARPVDVYQKLLPAHGVQVESSGGLPLSVKGRLTAGHYEIPGDTSSQYITGLLLALPLLEGDSAVVLTTPLQSKPYVDMTIKIMAAFGVFVQETDFGYLVKGDQSYRPVDFQVEGDWSHAAFFLAAGAIGGNVALRGLDMDSAQGDKAVVHLLKQFGADITVQKDCVTCRKKELKGIEIDASQIPDMVPALAVTAAFAQGKTVIKGAERLRLKESDRIASIIYNLKALGVPVRETEDGMVIEGGAQLHSAALKGFHDHRIVMAFSVCALFVPGGATIDDPMSIDKSYPAFFEDYNYLGGKAGVISNR